LDADRRFGQSIIANKQQRLRNARRDIAEADDCGFTEGHHHGSETQFSKWITGEFSPILGIFLAEAEARAGGAQSSLFMCLAWITYRSRSCQISMTYRRFRDNLSGELIERAYASLGSYLDCTFNVCFRPIADIRTSAHRLRVAGSLYVLIGQAPCENGGVTFVARLAGL
jgi:hypothetical protein